MASGRPAGDAPLVVLRGVGPVRSRRLAAAGFHTLTDLLWHLPTRYEDRRTLTAVAEVAAPGPLTLQGRLRSLSRVRLRRRRASLVRGLLDDGTGLLPIVWFNRPYLPNQIEEGAVYRVHGAVRRHGDRWELVNPSCERPERALLSGAIVPVYPAIGELGPSRVRALIDQVVERLEPARSLAEPVPRRLLERHRLPALGRAVESLHRPDGTVAIDLLNARRSPAHRRLVYGELLDLQLELACTRARHEQRPKAHRYRLDAAATELLRSLPRFRLTGAQERVIREIVADLARPEPMLRLLQGDVGSGKTIVAALTLVAAAESGLQSAFMAPTEILAEQHFRSLRALLGERYRIGLLTGSTPAAAARRRELAAGELQIAVGTHALIQERVRFRRLALCVIDEQHRFGVAQRQLLQGKGERLDLLVMTATPIPRSLALTAYGDLGLSVIDELPPGRSPVRTEVRPLEARGEVYRWLSERLAAGDQAYVVLPLIEESDRVEAASIAGQGRELCERFAAFEPRLLHGRTPPEAREGVLEAFARGASRLLIATTVIEVGLDVPAANVLVIENAERFGLAQLHQLRGRIGRAPGQRAVCVALHGALTGEGRRRLEMFAATRDGFRLAEADLALRGPGDLLGTRQAGLPCLRIADLAAHGRWVERARADARELMDDPNAAAAGPLMERAQRRSRQRYPLAGG